MNIEFSNEKDVLIMKIDGEIDHRYSIRIRNEADRKIVTYPDRHLVMDLSGVSFVDSSVIGVIIGRYKQLKARNINGYVTNVSDSVDKIFRMSGLYEIFPLLD